MGDIRKKCDWPLGAFRFHDSPGKHNPCYVVMPGGAMIALNHHAGEGVDIARAKFIVEACNMLLQHHETCGRIEKVRFYKADRSGKVVDE